MRSNEKCQGWITLLCFWFYDDSDSYKFNNEGQFEDVFERNMYCRIPFSFHLNRLGTWSVSWKCFKKDTKQESIPVGCVPAARWPYAGVCFPGGALSPGGRVCSWGACLTQGVCVSALGGCLLPGGACLTQGVWHPSMHWGRHPYPPPWTEWQTGVKILPWPQLRCGR